MWATESSRELPLTLCQGEGSLSGWIIKQVLCHKASAPHGENQAPFVPMLGVNRVACHAVVHGVTESWMQLVTSLSLFTFHFHALEKEMATHSSVLAWRIPGTGSLVGCRLWGRTELDTTEAT